MIKYQATALVIANSEYEFMEELECCVKDGQEMIRQFESLNIHVEAAFNLRRIDLLRCIDSFLKIADKYEVAIIYYSGHGMQVDNENYIVPIDCAPYDKKATMIGNLINLNDIVEELESDENRKNIIILDACRSVRTFVKGFSYAEGLAEISTGSGTFIAFATAPGKQAIAGVNSEEHSLFTKHLLRYLTQPNLSIEGVFKLVRQAVEYESEGNQIPWESTSLKHEFYFNQIEDEEISELIHQVLRDIYSAEALIMLSRTYKLSVTDVFRRFDHVQSNRPGGIVIRNQNDYESYILKRILDLGFEWSNYRWVYQEEPVIMGDFLFDPRKLKPN